MTSEAIRRSDLEQQLSLHGQQHLLNGWDNLTAAQQRHLARQVQQLDLARLARLFEKLGAGEDWAELASRAVSPPAFRLDTRDNRFSSTEARQRGEAALAAGRVGAILVAGGQGSRLGFEHPKGMYPIGPVSQAPLFQILFERLLAIGRRHGVRIPLFLMTSPATHDETVEFLESQDRYGLLPDDLHIFCQGTMPAVDASTGKVLLSSEGEIALSPDGHGGMLAALASSGSLDKLRSRDIEQLFYFQVDNPLCEVCGPEFLGCHLLSESEMSTQVVAKQAPEEKLGVVVSIDGQTRIIEYSDLPKEAAGRRAADGSLELWAGSIAVHVFDRRFLERVAGDAEGLPFHIARKQVVCLDEQGQPFEPTSPNAIKFERFIFDLLPFSRNAIVVEVDPAQAFAPVKNAPGAERDSPNTVRAMMTKLHRGWLASAGVEVKADTSVEISPLFALDAADVSGKTDLPQQITEPTYLR